MPTKLTPEMFLSKDFRPTNNITNLLNNLRRTFEEATEESSSENPLPKKIEEKFGSYKDTLLSFYTMGLTHYESSINTSQKVIQKEWNLFQCPNCEHSFENTVSLTRCPFCGQKIS